MSLSFTRNLIRLEATFTDKHYDLITAARIGDARAQQQLYKLYVKSMYNIAMRILDHVAEAEDVIQEAFVYVFMHLDEFRHEASFGAWMKQIVVNRSINVIRKRRTAIIEFAENIDDREQEEDDIDVEEMEWQVAEIREAIQKLPDGYRVVISLYLLEGYDHEEIAEVLGISESTSRTQYMRAKQRVVELVKKKQTEKSIITERRLS